MTLPHLGHLDRSHGVVVPPEHGWDHYRKVIEDAILNHPRSLQVALGPSEIGIGCDRCLVLKLAGRQEVQHYAPWLPFIGTAVHEALANVFHAENTRLGYTRYLIETRVEVGKVDGVEIAGSSDMFDLELGEVTDHKIVGITTQRKVRKNGSSVTYTRQGQCYGYGFERRGLRVNRVRIIYYPRNAMSLKDAEVDVIAYDRQVALDAIARADMFAQGIRALGVDTILAATPPHTGEEFSCDAWGDAVADPKQMGLSGLILSV